MNGPAYWAPDVAPADAKEHPLFASIQHAGPWQYSTHPQGGTLATWKDYSRSLSDYQEPRLVVDGLHYMSPKVIPHIHDVAKEGGLSGVDVALACGIALTIPHATVTHRQLRLGRSAERFGDPVTEYGRTACRVMELSKANNGVPYDSPELLRLLELAISQRYRGTQEFFDDMGFLSAEDVDPLLGAIWCGDPKAMAPESNGGPSASPISDSTGAK